MTTASPHPGTLWKSEEVERVVADYLREHSGSRSMPRSPNSGNCSASAKRRSAGSAGRSAIKVIPISNCRCRRLAPPQRLRQCSCRDRRERLAGHHQRQSRLASGREPARHAAHADGARLERAVEALCAARKILFVGVGGAASICDEAAHLFIKAGLDAIAYRDGYTQTIGAANMTPADVMVGVSHTGTTDTVAVALEIARENGATTIAITSDAASPVAQSRACHLDDVELINAVDTAPW
jgi:RpiR family carbohydrate utilization transcriptional regulator